MHQRILAAFDGSHEARLAVDEAAALARAFGGRVRVVWAIGSPRMPEGVGLYSVEQLREEEHRTATASLAELQHRFDADGTAAETGVLMLGDRDDDIGGALEHEAVRWQADTIVVGSQGKRGLARILLGSVAERTVKVSRRTVIVVRAQHPDHAGS
ncbi:universal stress protein [Ralstonia pseudosolanacearum]|uniref:universal stress protein n=1 Tax=Ralstonia pseudosolanacearum TaxID=1310165 RepID=UPI001FFB966F|nr:universal stress protein [Ralstonia pseudosolanacearum]